MFEHFDAFIESLGLPESCSLNQRLFKKQFYELTKMPKAQKERFAKAVESIVWTHTLKKGTINIPPLVTEELEYIEIAYIHVDLQEKAYYKKVAEVIHAIPYPVVFWMTHGNGLMLSTAPKRINQSDRSKLTIEEYLYSGWIDLQHPNKEAELFLKSLNVRELSFENFYRFYTDICERIVAFEAAQMGLGFSTDDTPQKKPILDKINKLNDEIRQLRNSIKKEAQFNVKVRLNMQIKEKEKMIEELRKSLEE